MLHSDVYTGLCCWLVCLRACAQPPARACSGALLLPKPRVRLRTGWQRSMAPSARAPHTGTRPSASCAVLDQVGVVPGVCVCGVHAPAVSTQTVRCWHCRLAQPQNLCVAVAGALRRASRSVLCSQSVCCVAAVMPTAVCCGARPLRARVPTRRWLHPCGVQGCV